MNKLEQGIQKLRDNNINEKYAYYLFKYLENLDEFEEAINKVIAGMPVQYIVGNVDFYDLNIKVNSNVLIPRFETEELVEKTLSYVNDFFGRTNIDIADIGTGSGCIALALAKNLYESTVDAVDISKSALEIASENAFNNNISINIICGNLLEPLKKKYDLIISNPPYISYDEEIMDLVYKNEPHLALFADNDGLYYYEEILKNIEFYLNEKAMIAFEIGSGQGKKIQELAYRYINGVKVIIEKDLQGRNRFVFIFIG